MSPYRETAKLKAGKALWMLAALVAIIAVLKAAQSFFTMVLKVAMESSDEFRWIGVAISSEQPSGTAEKKILEVTPHEQVGSSSPDIGVERA